MGKPEFPSSSGDLQLVQPNLAEQTDTEDSSEKQPGSRFDPNPQPVAEVLQDKPAYERPDIGCGHMH